MRNLQPGAAESADGRFAREVAGLKNCKKLRALAAGHSASERLSPHNERLKSALVPWYLGHCLFSRS